MGRLRKLHKNLCANCVYRCRVGNFGHNGQIACNYIEVEGQSRIFVNGEKVIPDGYCDKYVCGAESISSSRKWCEQRFLTDLQKQQIAINKEKERQRRDGKYYGHGFYD